MVLADNQIGYHNENVHLKTFYVIRNKDLFYEHLDDGIHEISVQQYREFNRSKEIHSHINAGIGKILMLKKNKQYMFLLKKYVKSLNREKLYILDGGSVHSADYNEQYYFDNMETYVKAVKTMFNDYWNVQKNIAQMIKKVGGDGTIHGCIIDIDFYDHAYLNPFDGSLTFYYATSITNKYVYENMGVLLEDRIVSALGDDKERFIEMASKYHNLLLKNNEGALQTISTEPVFVGSTDMYKDSRIVKRFQYIADNDILRIWHNGILSYYNSKEKNQLLDFSSAFSMNEIEDKYEID